MNANKDPFEIIYDAFQNIKREFQKKKTRGTFELIRKENKFSVITKEHLSIAVQIRMPKGNVGYIPVKNELAIYNSDKYISIAPILGEPSEAVFDIVKDSITKGKLIFDERPELPISEMDIYARIDLYLPQNNHIVIEVHTSYPL